MKRLGIMALVGALALLSLGTQALAGGKVVYIGDLSETGPPQPTIKLNVHTKRHHDGKVVTTITYVELEDAYYTCSDGQVYAPGSTGGNRSDLSFSDPRITLKGRSFSRRVIEDSSDLYLNLAGTIPKHGRATGTARLTESVDPPLGNCDSGVLTWTADRQ